MKGLLVKETCSIYSCCKLFLVIPIVFYGALMAGTLWKGQDIAGFPVGMIFMMMGIIPASVVNQEVQSKWHLGVLTMPYTRTQIVSAKYIITLIITVLTLVVTAGVMVMCLAFGRGISASGLREIVKVLFGGIGMGLMPTIVMMPTNFKFYGTVGGARVIISILLGGFIGGTNMMMMEMIQKDKLFGSGFIFMCLSVVLFFISWGVSILLFRKKDA